MANTHSLSHDAYLSAVPDQDPRVFDGARFQFNNVEVYRTVNADGGPRGGPAFRVEQLTFAFYSWQDEVTGLKDSTGTDWRVECSYATIRDAGTLFHGEDGTNTRVEVSFSLPLELADGSTHLLQLHIYNAGPYNPDGVRGPVTEWRRGLPSRPLMLKKSDPNLQVDFRGQIRHK